MKTHFTMTVAEAEHRLAGLMFDELPYTDNEISVKINVPEVGSDNLPIGQVSKIALIKLVRTLAEDVLQNRVKVTTREAGNPYAGEKYFGLGDAKEYVEKYLKANSPQI